MRRIGAMAATGILLVAANMAMAGDLTQAVQATRVTVVDVDRGAGHFLCLGHAQRIMRGGAIVVRGEERRRDLRLLNPGDLVRLEFVAGHLQKIVVLRTASDEIRSPEN